MNIQLYGYNIQKNDSILIIEKFRGIIIDSFSLAVSKINYSSTNKLSIHINDRINVKNTYLIYIGSEKNEIKDFVLEMQPEFTMCEKGYGCSLTKFKLNNEEYNYKYIPIYKTE